MDYTTIHNAATKIVGNLKTIDGSINALQNKQDIISTSDMSMANSHNGKLKIEEIGGKCEQFTTTGAQLFDGYNALIKRIGNYVTDNIFTYEDNSSVSITDNVISGTTDKYLVVACPFDFVQGKTVYNVNSLGVRPIMVYDIEGNPLVVLEYPAKSYTPTESFSGYIGFGLNTKTVVNSEILFAYSEDVSFEPYTGGIPAPNPDYPQEIKKVVVSEIKTHGKNLVNNTAVSQTIGGLTFTVNSDGSVIVNGKSPDDANVIFGLDNTIGERLTIGDTYILSGCPSGGSKDTYRLDCVRQGVTAYMVDSGERSRYTVTENTISPRIRIWIGKGVTINNLTFYPMLRKADSGDNTYEPYTESTIKLSEPIELYGIGDVKDTIEDGKVVRRFASVMLDGTKNITRAPQERDNTTYRFYISDAHTEAQTKRYASNERPCILSDTLNPETTDRVYWSVEGISVASSGVFMLYHEKFKNFTVDQMREFLSNTPANVVYRLAEPVTEPLPVIDQIALNSLSTYDTITYLDFDSEIEPTFQAEYGVTEIGGRVLEDLMTGLNSEILAQSDADRIAVLESTIVNNI